LDTDDEVRIDILQHVMVTHVRMARVNVKSKRITGRAVVGGRIGDVVQMQIDLHFF